MSAAFIDHLWQSSLFALFAGLLTLLLRKNGAHFRYWVWFAASVKFLVPFSLLAMVGTQFGWHTMSVNVQIPFANSVQQIAAPLLAPAATILPAEAASDNMVYLALFVWALGCAGLLTRWFVRWLALLS